VVAPLVIAGPINGDIFRAWVEQMLAPALQPGDIVVLDNLGSHKVAGIEEAIGAWVPSCVICRSIAPTTTRSSKSLPS
jgi:transposase